MHTFKKTYEVPGTTLKADLILNFSLAMKDIQSGTITADASLSPVNPVEWESLGIACPTVDESAKIETNTGQSDEIISNFILSALNKAQRALAPVKSMAHDANFSVDMIKTMATRSGFSETESPSDFNH